MPFQVLANNITSLGDDILVYQDKENPHWMFSVDVTEDGKYIVMYVYKDCSTVRYVFYFLSHCSCCSSKIFYGLPTSTRTTLARISNG